MDAEPEPIPESVDAMSVAGGASFCDDVDIEDVADTNFDEEGQQQCIGDGKAAQLVQSVLSDMTHGTTGSLMQVLATEPSDYSYFNKALLRTWAGPSHWKAGHLSTDSWKANTAKLQKSKTKKTVFRLDFDEEMDFGSHFRTSKATSLTKASLNKYSKDQTTLPKDHHYEADKLFRIFSLKRVMIKRQKASADGVDDVIENYDYENVNDMENYCPNDDVNGDDDDDHSGDLEFNFGTDGGDMSQESSSQDPFSQSQETFLQNGDNTILGGDKLLAQPYKVAKIDIDYAKTAKRLDVKRLKSSMWNLLKAAPVGETSVNNPEEMDTGGGGDAMQGTSGGEGSEAGKEMPGTITFQSLLSSLPGKVSGQTAKNLSVPIAFVCLLHLANEKTLKIEDINMEDLQITQGI